jgi:hypothetical protein
VRAKVALVEVLRNVTVGANEAVQAGLGLVDIPERRKCQSMLGNERERLLVDVRDRSKMLVNACGEV